MKRIISLLVAALLVVLPLLSASAAVVVPMASVYFSSYSVGFLKGDDGLLTIRFSVQGIEVSDVLGVSTYNIQKLSNGSWVNATSSLSGSLGYDVVSHSFAKLYCGTPGTTYRVHCYFVCQNSNGYSTQEYYSTSVVARE